MLIVNTPEYVLYNFARCTIILTVLYFFLYIGPTYTVVLVLLSLLNINLIAALNFS